MRAFIISLLLFIVSQSPLGVYAQCSYYDPIAPDPGTAATCASSSSISADPTDVPNLPSAGTKQLTGTFMLKITDFCSNTPPLTIFSIRAYTGSAYKTVYEIRANSLTSYSSYLTDTAGTQLLSHITTDTTNGWLAAAVSFDLTNNIVTHSWMSALDYSTISATNLNFGSWIFKANANPSLMNFAYDPVNSKSSKAESQKISFGYTYETNLFPLLFGSPSPTRLGLYAMLENTGYTLADAASLGTAYFGSSTASAYDATYAPSWTAIGVLFTSRSQYIRIPSALMFKPTNPLVASVSITFMFRLDELYAGTIFSRVSTTSQMVMGLKINAYGNLQPVMGDIVITTSQTALKINEWIQISVFYMYSEGRIGASISFDDTLVTPNLETTPLKFISSFSEKLSDTFKIGGFKGSIRNFAVYGPGSPLILASKCSTCALDMGTRTAACISPKCASNQYVSGQICQPCSSACNSCAGAGSGGCQSCVSPKVLSPTTNTCDDPPPPPTTPPTTTPDPSTPTTTPTSGSSTSNIQIEVETGTGFDVDVYISIVVGVIALAVMILIVVKHAKKKALETTMHQAVPSSPGMRNVSSDMKAESFY